MKVSILILGLLASTASSLQIDSFWVVDAESNAYLKELTPGMTLDLASLPASVNIEAKASDDTESVKIIFNGKERVDNGAPYTADWKALEAVELLPMKQNLSAISYSENDAAGAASPEITIDFNIIDSRLTTPEIFSVTKMHLHNADTDELLFAIVDGSEIDLLDLPTLNVAIVAVTSPSEVGSVRMEDVSSRTYARTENGAPYALTGDIDGDFRPMDLRVGAHTLSATPYSKRNMEGAEGKGLAISYTVKASVAVTGYTLIDASSDTEIGPLTDGLTLDLAKLPSSLNIKVETNLPGVVESVQIEFDGKVMVENSEPYAVGRDSKGDYDHLDLLPMPYTLKATPFVHNMAEGEAGASMTLSFTVINSNFDPSDIFSVQKFLLVNGETDQPILEIVDGMSISIEEVGDNLNIDASTLPADVGSVVIAYGDNSRTENKSPYALFGDSNGDFSGRSIRPGDYTLEATPFSEPNGQGTAGAGKKVSFKVVKAFSCLGGALKVGLAANGCSFEALLQGIQAELDKISSCKHGAELELEILSGQEDLRVVQAAVDEVCEGVWAEQSKNFFDHDRIGSEELNTVFTKAFYDGGTNWNDFVQRDAPGIATTYNNVAQVGGISWPGEKEIMDNFQNCDLRAVMCCWVRDVADNTDVCYTDMRRSRSSAKVNNGFALFEGDETAHCHGFAWGNDENGFDSMYKGNSLFYISMYDHLSQRGYTDPIVGAPMCGCVENMAVVTRADCTELVVRQPSVFYYDENGLWATMDEKASISYQACQGAQANDLQSYYAKLVADNKASVREQERFERIVVGQCNANDFLQSRGWKRTA